MHNGEASRFCSAIETRWIGEAPREEDWNLSEMRFFVIISAPLQEATWYILIYQRAKIKIRSRLDGQFPITAPRQIFYTKSLFFLSLGQKYNLECRLDVIFYVIALASLDLNNIVIRRGNIPSCCGANVPVKLAPKQCATCNRLSYDFLQSTTVNFSTFVVQCFWKTISSAFPYR